MAKGDPPAALGAAQLFDQGGHDQIPKLACEHGRRAARGLVRVLPYYVAEHLDQGTLMPVLEQYEADPKPATLVWPASRHSVGRVELLVDYLKGLKDLKVLNEKRQVVS